MVWQPCAPTAPQGRRHGVLPLPTGYAALWPAQGPGRGGDLSSPPATAQTSASPNIHI